MTGVVTSNIGLNIRAQPTASSAKLGALAKSANVTITDSAQGDGATWYKISSGWICGKYVKTSGGLEKSNPVAEPSIAKKPEKATDTFTVPDLPPVVNAQTTEKLKDYYWTYVRSMGCPPMYNKNVDLQYIDEFAPGCGRVFGQTMLSNPVILSLCPGKVRFLPGFNGEEQKTFYESLKQFADGNSTPLTDWAKEDITDGKLYEFTADLTDYGNVLNVLCRTAAMFLDVGDKKMINSQRLLKDFDYTQWTFPSKYREDNKGNLFSVITKTAQAAVDDSNYMHYFVASGNTSAGEEMNTGIEHSMIEEAINNSAIDTLARNLNYLLGGVANADAIRQTAGEDLEALLGGDSFLSKLGRGFSNYMSGGRMVMPQMIGDISYGKSLNVQLKFASPYGDKLSVFFYCVVPTMSLLAMALPKQISENMYTYPFIVRCYQPGQFNSDLAVITDIRVERGGSDDTSWTIDGLATEWDVSFTVQPLYNSLMTSSTKTPFLFMNNGGIIEYLGNLCGIDLKANNLSRKIEIGKMLIANRFTDIPTNMARGVTEKFVNHIYQFFQWVN